jgi:hypothetical protein
LIDSTYQYIKQIIEHNNDPETIALTLRYFDLARQLTVKEDWVGEESQFMSCRGYFRFADDEERAVFSVRTDGVVQLWPITVAKHAPSAINEWFTAQLARWPELSDRGTESPLFHLEREFKTEEDIEKFEYLFTKLKEKLEG